jgi:hypothetical protein
VKAVFEVTLVVPRHLMAFSNMPEVESAEKPNGEPRNPSPPTCSAFKTSCALDARIHAKGHLS